MKLCVVATVLCTGLVILVGCDGETGTSVTLSTDSSLITSEFIERHPSGRISASGQVLPGTTTRVGQWTTWHDDESGAKQWDGFGTADFFSMARLTSD